MGWGLVSRNWTNFLFLILTTQLVLQTLVLLPMHFFLPWHFCPCRFGISFLAFLSSFFQFTLSPTTILVWFLFLFSLYGFVSFWFGLDFSLFIPINIFFFSKSSFSSVM